MPRILRHGKPGQKCSASSPSRTAASLISRSLRSTAATVFGSSRNASKSMSNELEDHVDALQDISQ
jgi:hypothetical protein